MTSLQDLLPEPGTSNWRKSKSYSTDSGDVDDASVRHVVIREVWLENRPTPHAVYKVDVMSKSAHWSIFRRYREFYQLHQVLMKKFGIPKEMLPPRKFANSLSKDTLYKRREALEHFLQRIINSSGRGVSCCDEVLEFLDVKSHDVTLVSNTLAKYFRDNGERILAAKEGMQFTPSQLYCITHQLRLPHPAVGHRVDLANLYDFISQIERVVISDMLATASKGQQHMTNVSYDISLFSSLRDLRLDGCPVGLIQGFSSLPSKLTKFTARYSVRSMKELLVDCATETRKAPALQTNAEAWRAHAALKLVENRMIIQPWLRLTHLNLSHNYITSLDSSFSILPLIKELDLSYNKITHLDMTHLENSSLQKLSLVANDIYLISGSTKTNMELTSLNIRQNRIHTIEGLLCLQSLTSLDLAQNSIVLMAEIRKLGALPRLHQLWVAGNPIAKRKRHRVTALYYFMTREFELDGKAVTSKEKAKIESRSQSREDNSGMDDNLSISTVSDDDLDSGIEGHVPASRLEPLLEEEYLIIGRDLEPIALTLDRPNLDSSAKERFNDDNSRHEDECSLDVDPPPSETRSREEWDQILRSTSHVQEVAVGIQNEAVVGTREVVPTLLAQSKVWEESSERVSVFERLCSKDSVESLPSQNEASVSKRDVTVTPCDPNVASRLSIVETSTANITDSNKKRPHLKEGTLLFKSQHSVSNVRTEEMDENEANENLSSTRDDTLRCTTEQLDCYSNRENTCENEVGEDSFGSRINNEYIVSSKTEQPTGEEEIESHEIAFEWSHYQPQVITKGNTTPAPGDITAGLAVVQMHSVEEIQVSEEAVIVSSSNIDCEKAEECDEDCE